MPPPIMTQPIHNRGVSTQSAPARPLKNPNRTPTSQTAHTASTLATSGLSAQAQRASQTNFARPKTLISGLEPKEFAIKFKEFISKDQFEALMEISTSDHASDQIDEKLKTANKAAKKEAKLNSISSQQRELQNSEHSHLISALSNNQEQSEDFLATLSAEFSASTSCIQKDARNEFPNNALLGSFATSHLHNNLEEEEEEETLIRNRQGTNRTLQNGVNFDGLVASSNNTNETAHAAQTSLTDNEFLYTHAEEAPKV